MNGDNNRRIDPFEKYLSRGDKDENDWMLSYGDMMTLLLVFFVLLVAVSEIDAVKLQMITQSMRNAMGTEVSYVPTLKEIEARLKQSIKEMDLQDVVYVNRDKRGVQLMLRGESFFPSGEASLYSNTYPFLNMIAQQIHETPYRVSIEGHTDNIPIQTARFPSNWELSGSRAGAVVRYFEEQKLPPDRFNIAGFADTKPIDPEIGNSTPEARALNRRVVITFINEFYEEPGAVKSY